MRVVVVTNVFISGLLSSSGPPGKVLDAWLDGAVELVLSEWLVGEYRKVTTYPHIVRATKRPDADLSAFNSFLPFGPMSVVRPEGSVRDPDDRNVLGAALHLGADVIISGDKDLLVLGEFAGIPILTPRQFLDRLGELDASAPEPRRPTTRLNPMIRPASFLSISASRAPSTGTAGSLG